MVTFYAVHSKFFPTFSKHLDIMSKVNTLSYTQRSRMLLQMHPKCACRIHLQNGIVYADTLKNPFLELLMRIYPCHIMEVSE